MVVMVVMLMVMMVMMMMVVVMMMMVMMMLVVMVVMMVMVMMMMIEVFPLGSEVFRPCSVPEGTVKQAVLEQVLTGHRGCIAGLPSCPSEQSVGC